MPANRYKIIYEDDQLIVVDKPSGMLVIPTPKQEKNTLTGLLNRDLDSRGIGVHPVRENNRLESAVFSNGANAHPCHRIDRETSGLIIYAKGKKMQKLMMDQFKSRKVSKRYIVIVRGSVKKSFDTIRSSIYNRNRKRGEEALTRYRVISRRGSFSVLEAEPVTGRTNQIRIHLAGIGHPILGERVYAFRRDFKIRFNRVALHASRIEFAHPVTGAKMSFSSPLPEDMKNLIK
jgi:23S rRNA pseudouridine1911/1915/1917 synthase